jgi:hypothetical protein
VLDEVSATSELAQVIVSVAGGTVSVGGVVFAVMVIVAVFVQPFVLSTAVTVYVPAAVTVAGFGAFTNDPPFHAIVLPAETPVSVALGLVQEIFPDEDAVTVGGVVFDVTTTVAVDVHPFAGFVAVQVYVPAAETVAGFAAFTNVPPFHTIVLPADVPVSVAVGVMQLILFPAAVTTGGVVLDVTVTVEVF